jgi:uncharacterized membrane protein
MAQYNKISDTKKEVDTVIEIMKDNMNKVLDRDQKLDDMETRTEELQDGAKRFNKISTKLKHKMWCKNTKFIIILASIFLILILIILLIIFKK